jgi:hypothetical protein
MAVTDSEEVLLASTVLAGTSASSSANSARLDVQPLDDGLDDEVAAGQVGEGAGELEPVLVPGGHASIDAAFFDQLVPLRADGFACLFGGARLRVHQLDGAAGLRGDLRDAAPHRASANYSHICKFTFMAELWLSVFGEGAWQNLRTP